MYKIKIFKLLPFFFVKKQAISYLGNVMGIHYDYKSTRGAKAMEKQAKRDKKLAEKRAKKQAKAGNEKEKEQDKTIPLTEVITLSHLTDPEKK